MKKIHLRSKSSLIGIIVAFAAVGGTWFGLAHANGSATFTLSPASASHNIGESFTVTIQEEDGSNGVGSVQADLTYDQSKLQLTNINEGVSNFGIPASSTGGNGTISIQRGNISPLVGTKTVAALTFKVLAGSGSTEVNFANSSLIYHSSPTPPYTVSEDWNHKAAPNGGTYTLTTPPAPTCSAGQTGTYPNCVTPSGTSSGSSGSSSSGSSGSTTTNSSNKTTPAAASGSPSATDQAADPTAPVEASNVSTSGQGFLVAIKVLDNNGNVVKGATVTIDNQTVTSDETGIAGFANIGAGAHTATIKSPHGTVKSAFTVAGNKSPSDVQNFTLKVKHDSILPIVFAAGGGIVLVLLVGLTSLWQIRKRRHSKLGSTSSNPPVVGTETPQDSDPATFNTTAPVPPAGATIQPQEPVKPEGIDPPVQQ